MSAKNFINKINAIRTCHKGLVNMRNYNYSRALKSSVLVASGKWWPNEWRGGRGAGAGSDRARSAPLRTLDL